MTLPIPLRHSVPLVILLCGIIGVTSLCTMNTLSSNRDLEVDLKENTIQQGCQLTAAVEDILRYNKPSDLLRFIGTLGTSPYLKTAIVTDDRDQIVAATKTGLCGTSLDTLDEIVAERKQLARKTITADVWIVGDHSLVIGIFPVIFPESRNENRPSSIGFLALEYDLAAIRHANFEKQLGLYGSIIALFASISLIMFLFFNRFLTGRAEQLRQTADHFAQGHLSDRITLAGSDEFAAIARSFNEMANTLVADKAALEKHRDHLESMVEARTAEAVQAQKSAEAANKAKSLFLANMSHELRTPLNAIIGFTQIMARDSAANPGQREHLAIILKSGEHLLALINDVLDLAKIESGKIALQPADTDLGALLNDTTEMLRIRAEAKGLHLRLDQTSSFPRFVRTDAGKLRQVVINLVGNAIKFTDRGEVKIKLSVLDLNHATDRIRLLFEVSDTGPGIAPEDLERIFRPFEQALRKTTTEGTGLGLTISREYINLLGGSITVESTPGAGSTFRFSIVCSSVEGTSIPALHTHNGRIAAVSNAERFRLLIVEDQLENRLLLKALLEPVGFQYREAADGRQAVEMAREWQPHLILMDRRMPVMDGLVATREIRKLALPTPPVIIAVTAHAYEEEQKEMLDAGCNSFLGKPFREQDLFDLLASRLDIRVLYTAPAPQPEAIAPPLTPELFANVTNDLRTALETALTNLDMAAVETAIAGFRQTHPALAKQLKQETDNLAYSDILDVLKRVRAPAPE